MTGNDVRHVDDVGFFRKMFDRVAIRHGGDPLRIFVTGNSNGGIMTYRLAIELGHRIRAAAAVIANMPETLAQLRPTAQVPMLIMNGTEDPLQIWEGTTTAQGSVMLSASASMTYWVRSNRGAAQPRVSSTWRPDLDPRDGSTVEVIRAHRLNAPVVLYAIHGGGHTMPGGESVGPLLRRIVGTTNQDIDGHEEILGFFLATTR